MLARHWVPMINTNTLAASLHLEKLGRLIVKYGMDVNEKQTLMLLAMEETTALLSSQKAMVSGSVGSTGMTTCSDMEGCFCPCLQYFPLVFLLDMLGCIVPLYHRRISISDGIFHGKQGNACE